MSKKVVIADYEYDQIENEKKVMAEHDLDLVPCQCQDEEDVIEVAKDADGLLNQYSPLTRKVIDNLEKCKVITTYGIGVDKIDVEAATDNAICVANVPDYCIQEVSNHAIALMMSLQRGLFSLDRAVKNNEWSFKVARPISRLSKKVVGIVALGKIGREVARKLQPYCQKILGFDPYLTEEKAEELNIELVELEKLLRKSDIISLHAPLTEETRHMIDEDEFKIMKDSSILINVGRGGLINEEALYQALKGKLISCAGVDVLEKEPPPADYKLFELDNLITTPHAAYYSEDAQDELQRKAAEEVARVLAENKFPKSLVNPEVKNKVNLQE